MLMRLRRLLISLAKYMLEYVINFTCPTSDTAVTLKTGRRENLASSPRCACQPSRSEFSVVFSETRLNTG